MTEAELEQSYDQQCPVVEDGTPPPMRIVKQSDGSERRIPENCWTTRVGKVVIRWRSGKAFRIAHTLFPDGARGLVVEAKGEMFRRRALDERHWVHGSIDIQKSDVLFLDGAQPVYAVEDKRTPSLERDLAGDAEFRAALADDTFAKAVYTVLARTFVHEQTGTAWSCGQESGGAIVAGLRGLGEIYSDFYDAFGGKGLPGDTMEAEDDFWSTGLSRFVDGMSLDAGRPADLSEEQYLTWLKETQRKREEIVTIRAALRAAREENGAVFEAVYSHFKRLGWRKG